MPANGVLTPELDGDSLINLLNGELDENGNFIPPVMDGQNCWGEPPPCYSNEDCPNGTSCQAAHVCVVDE